MTDFKEACAEACAFVKDHQACDRRCTDGRGRCSLFLAHMVGLTGLRVDEIRERWRAEQ
jgi:hypothetical protein